MTWTYAQKTGDLSKDGVHVATGYSGHGAGLNNPDMQAAVGIGPIPRGTWRIGPPHTPVDHIGPMALSLIPADPSLIFHRSGFFIHGDNSLGNHSASNGCIILGPAIRKQIHDSGDTNMVVVSG